MLQIRAKILYNKRVKGDYFHLVLGAAGIAKESLPGQFLNIKVNDTDELLLRRPLSIHRVKKTDIGLLYAVVGPATEVLSQHKAGGYLDVIGPLGNGFNYPLNAKRYPLSILVAGGMGVAPLVFLAEKLAYSVERVAYRKNKEAKLNAKRYPLNAIVLIGAKTKSQLLCEKEFKDLGCEVKTATDDGSKGFKGYVSELLKEILMTSDLRLTTIYACGPKPMLKEIALISKKYKISAQLSLEEHMACGIGACLGCVVNTTEGFQRVCKEGPVFSTDTIIW